MAEKNRDDVSKRPKSGVTARDVAELVGVSPSTISRVLNNNASTLISETTRQRVLAAAEQLGYTPDPIARALRGKKSNLLGLIVREIADPFFARFISELSVQARARSYHLVLGHAQSDPEEALTMTDVLDTRHTDGVIVLGDLKNDEATLQEMLVGKHAVVAVCRGPHLPRFIPSLLTIMPALMVYSIISLNWDIVTSDSLMVAGWAISASAAKHS